MRKSLFYFVLASCFLVACKDKGNVNLNQPISWMSGYYIRFNPITLRSDTSQYYPKHGPYNGQAYLSYSHPITDFWTVFDLPFASLPAGESVTSQIIATTNVDYNFLSLN